MWIGYFIVWLILVWILIKIIDEFFSLMYVYKLYIYKE